MTNPTRPPALTEIVAELGAYPAQSADAQALVSWATERLQSVLAVPEPVARPGVSRVAVAVVDDVELFGIERRFESASNQRHTLPGHYESSCASLFAVVRGDALFSQSQSHAI